MSWKKETFFFSEPVERESWILWSLRALSLQNMLKLKFSRESVLSMRQLHPGSQVLSSLYQNTAVSGKNTIKLVADPHLTEQWDLWICSNVSGRWLWNSLSLAGVHGVSWTGFIVPATYSDFGGASETRWKKSMCHTDKRTEHYLKHACFCLKCIHYVVFTCYCTESDWFIREFTE